MQTEQSLQIAAYLGGIGVAVATFILKEAISHVQAGFRFRRRLTCDIKDIVGGFERHLPEVRALAQKAREAAAAKENARLSLPMIWDSDFSAMQDVFNNSDHLKPDEFQACLKFYSCTDSISEIRGTYNQAVRQMAVDADKYLPYLRIAKACLVDMEAHYRDAIHRGAGALVELKEHRYFLPIDLSHYRELRRLAPADVT